MKIEEDLVPPPGTRMTKPDKTEWVMLGNGEWFNLTESKLKTDKAQREFVLDIQRMKKV